MFTHFHALAAVTVSIRLSYSRGKPCFGPPSRVHSHLPALPRSHRPRLARKAVPKRYSSRSPVSRLSDLRLLYHHKTRLSTPNFAAPCHPPHSLFLKSLCAGGEEISPRYSFKGGLRGLGCRLGRRWTVATGDHRPFASPHGGEVSPAGSVGAERSPPESCAPLQPLYEAGLRSRLPPRSVLDGAHWAPGPPSHPPRARSSLAYCKRGFQKIILAFAYPFRPGYAVTERGEPGTYSRSQTKNPG